MWGVIIPRHKVCPEHVAPFTAFADAYFGRNSLDPDSGVDSIALWHGSRGLSGKSFMLSILGLTKAFMLGADVNLLGGSFAQSANIHLHMQAATEYKNAPRYMFAEEPTANLMKLTNKAKIRPLTASQRTVRGPHPPFLLLDEIDEMELKILDAALGQPMRQKNWLGDWNEPYTVMCSTWQNAEGTFTEIYRRAEEKKIPVYTWCVAQDSLVTTARGEVPIQQVTNSDLVLTRNGWRQVQHVTFMGYKPTLTLEVGGRVLRVTADHQIATPAGWREAGALAADAMAAIRANPGVLRGELMPLAAVSRSGLEVPGPGLVGSRGDGLQVLDVDAPSVSAEMVEVLALIEGADQLFPNPTVRLGNAAGDTLAAVAAPLEARPVDAVGVHGHILTPVWDIGVEDTHEFIAEGVLVHNCYKDTANPVDGWLTEKAIAEKKASIPAEMWRVEYELGEPSIGNRAFDSDCVEKTFSVPFEPIAKKEAKDYEEYVFAAPEHPGDYYIGADWAKEQDYTVIGVLRADRFTSHGIELVYWARLNRRPYPVMIKMFNEAMQRYGAQGEYDRTGLGNVVADLLDVRAHGFMMTGDKRASMLSEYVAALENDKFRFPKIPTAYISHKYAQVGDLYSNAKAQGFHLPDEVCALALAYYRICRAAPPASPLVVAKVADLNRYAKAFDTPADRQYTNESPGQGVVYMPELLEQAETGGLSLLV